MLARTVTHALVGLDPRRVEVEARLERASPSFTIVGLADRACQEAKERVRSGIRAAELEFPVRRITVNLAPAALRKEGAGFDLPIALAVLAASQQLPPDSLDGIAAFGELALDGRVRAGARCARRGRGARRSRATKLVCASESAPEVALAGVEPVPVFHLADAVAYLRGEYDPPPPDLPRRGSRSRPHPTWPTSAARSGGGARSRSRPPGVTTSCSRGRPAPARRCSPGACRASSRCSATRTHWR